MPQSASTELWVEAGCGNRQDQKGLEESRSPESRNFRNIDVDVRNDARWVGIDFARRVIEHQHDANRMPARASQVSPGSLQRGHRPRRKKPG